MLLELWLQFRTRRFIIVLHTSPQMNKQKLSLFLKKFTESSFFLPLHFI